MDTARILVIEDEEVASAMLVKLLSVAGYEVSLATDGRIALDLLETGLRPSLILLDMILPNLDGWKFMSLRRQDPDLAAIPVVIATGLTVASDEWAKSLGALAMLRKPVDPSRLMELMRLYCPA